MRQILFLLSMMYLGVSYAQRSNDINQALQCSISVETTDSIRIHWLPKADAISYQVDYRTDLETPYIAAGTTTDTFMVITPVDKRTSMEVRVTKFGGQRATGYLAVGVDYLPTHRDRRLLIIVEHSIADSIRESIDRYREVLRDERWQTTLLTLQADASVPSVKQAIIDVHTTSPLDQILLVGHVPVPYSGNNAIDGHTSGNNHRGAWPADVFYGELDGSWTDTAINNEEASRAANDNVPGDGKYDQTAIPGLVEVAVGRIDMSNLPAFDKTEVELTRAYFHKNLQYRTGGIQSTRRGLVDNNFNIAEGFAQGAIKSFAGFWPIDSTHYVDYAETFTTDYLWSYGAGAGNYRGASGITSTAGLAADSLQTIFTCLFGSYFGDWDIQDNFLRAALASGTTLINAWSGRPVWHFHTMAMGATVGDVVLLVQNNNGSYASTFGNRLAHIALMGDPTLQMYYYPPVDALSLDIDGQQVDLTWTGPEVDGYLVYEIATDSSFTRLTPEPITDTSYGTICSDTSTIGWVVTPVMLEESPSGSYYNHGAGATVWGEIVTSPVTASFDFQGDELEVAFINASINADDYLWDFGDGTMSTEVEPIHTYAFPGSYTVQLIASAACQTDTVRQDILVQATSIGSTLDVQSILIYPNPADDAVYISGAPQHSTISVINLDGKVLAFAKSTERINVSQVPAGIYVIEVTSPDIVLRRLIMIK